MEKTNPTWKYCAYTPKIVHGEGFVVDAAFGLAEENDMLAGYDFMFSANDGSYQVVDTCIHEVSSSLWSMWTISILVFFLLSNILRLSSLQSLFHLRN